MGPDKAWGAQQNMGARYGPSYPLEKFLSEALAKSVPILRSKLELIEAPHFAFVVVFT